MGLAMPNNKLLTRLRFIHATESYGPSSDGALVLLGRTAVLVHSGPNKKGFIGSPCRGEKLSEQTSGSPSFGHSVPHFDQMLTKLCFLL
jgi:hypothetical protein